ncbi:MAG: hypothetical protein IPG85_16625 [Bacteroidetes bacterium]|nr:hypothetical protein [Bacteroidota bacterium]
MRYLLLLILLVNCMYIDAQISDTFYNSLQKKIQPKDKDHISINEKIEILHDVKFSDCITYRTELNSIYESLKKYRMNAKYSDDIIRISAALGCYASKLEDSAFNQEAKIEYQQVLNLTNNAQKYNRELIEAYTKLSDIYYYENKLDSAFELISRFKQIINKDDTSSLLNLYFSYERIYTYLNQHEHAIEYQHYGINLYYKNAPNKDEYLCSLVGLARSFILLYENNKKAIYKDSALYYLNTVLNYENEHQEIWIPICSFYKGKLLFYEGLYQDAIEQFNHFDSSRVQGDDNYFFGTEVHNTIYRLLARVRLGDQSAFAQLETITIPYGLLELKNIVNKELYIYWQKNKHWEKAFKYLLAYNQTADSLNILNNRNKFFELNQKYKVADKEAKINALQISNLKRSRLLLLGGTFSFLIIGGFIFYLRFTKLKNKRKEALSELDRQKLLNKINTIELTHTAEKEKLQKEKENEILIQKQEISQNIHDEISNGIAALRYYIADVKLAAGDENLQNLLTDIEEEANSLYTHTRDFMNELRGDSSDKSHLISSFLDSLSVKFTNDGKLHIEIDAENYDIDNELIGKYQTELYYILKEAVVNSIKHANASHLKIDIDFKEQVCYFSIIDNGFGFDNTSQTEGMGIQNMKNRIKELNGVIEIFGKSSGTTVVGCFPYV